VRDQADSLVFLWEIIMCFTGVGLLKYIFHHGHKFCQKNTKVLMWWLPDRRIICEYYQVLVWDIVSQKKRGGGDCEIIFLRGNWIIYPMIKVNIGLLMKINL